MLDCLELLVGKARNRVRVLELVLSRNQQREDFAVCGRLRRSHPSYRPLAVTAEMAQQGRDKFLVQNRAVTRTVRTAAAVFNRPSLWFEGGGAARGIISSGPLDLDADAYS